MNPDKHLHSGLYLNPRVPETYDLKDYADKAQLIHKVNELSQQQFGFRVYKHSDQSNLREHRITLLCHNYSSTRCPFMITYMKTCKSFYFRFSKYRAEHNHPL